LDRQENYLTWEQTVEWLRQQPDQTEVVRACYLDDPLIEAARRFAQSPEWNAVQQFLPRSRGRALDLGAGRGISSYALTEGGWHVVALEPDPSSLVGTAAIHALTKVSGLKIFVVQGVGETIPFEDCTFDLVYARQVLHHSKNLHLFCQEVARVIKPQGHFIATREHVISKPEDLGEFFSTHPFHRLHGQENAFMLDEYVSAIERSGLQLLQVLGPFDTVINYYPMDYREWRKACIQPLTQRIGYIPAILLASRRHLVGRYLLQQLAMRLSASSDTPGRMYSFVAAKPA
jgi:SAM-dependent methyltransferase